MKKPIKNLLSTIVFLIAATQFSVSAKTQAPAAARGGGAFHKGSFYVGGALGLSSGFGPLGGITFIGNAEYALTNEIGLGGSIGYWSYSESFGGSGSTYKFSYSVIPIIVSGAYHFPLHNSKFDLAAGISLGYYIVNASVESSVPGATSGVAASGSGIAWGVFGLARYFVTDRLALRGKLGYGITFVEVGVDFRI